MSRRRSGKFPYAVPNAHQHLAGMAGIEKIDGSGVLPSRRSTLQVIHEPGCRHPEVIPHHHDRLDMLAVAMPKGGDQLGILLTSLRVEPLLELVQDEQDFPPGSNTRRVRIAASESTSPSPGADQDTPCASLSAAGSPSLPGSPRYRRAATCLASRGSKPALTSEDFPQPTGP